METKSLTELERHVLLQMASQHPASREAFEIQMSEVIVLKRENTGVGFYSKLAVEGSRHPIDAKVYDNIFLAVDGLKNPICFVLFLKDGIMDLLEGASVDETTESIEFNSVKFRNL